MRNSFKRIDVKLLSVYHQSRNQIISVFSLGLREMNGVSKISSFLE